MNNEIKFCKDCKFASPPVDKEIFYRCIHPKAELDLVTGEFPYASQERISGCGKEGKNFEPNYS